MPTTYAHYRFGKDVLSQLPSSLQKEIEQNLPLYQIGLHGPDILFYYKALSKNEVSSYGGFLHDHSAYEFLAPQKQVLSDLSQSASLFPYLYGFITHFILDTYCHPYVRETENITGLSHSEIEADFDRLLLCKDGLDPVSSKLTGHLAVTSEIAESISHFYPDRITADHIVTALHSMIKLLDFLVAPQKTKRFLINQVLKLSGNYEGMHGLIINYEPNPVLVPHCDKLYSLYQSSIPVCVQSILAYQDYLQNETALSAVFNRTFEHE
ncbi:MAG: zinc dependent phospholipase C family protein [Lachnospiraceae bacterium]|nr:zinc dependent phospholipase C family protein [Lachnospiraceae bacterium]